MDRGAWWATVHRVTRVKHNLGTKAPPPHSQASPRPCLWLERVVLKLQCLRGEPHGELINRADSGGSAFRGTQLDWALELEFSRINTEYSLEGLMLKLKCQFFGHLIQTANSLEKALMLAKIEGGRRRG